MRRNPKEPPKKDLETDVSGFFDAWSLGCFQGSLAGLGLVLEREARQRAWRGRGKTRLSRARASQTVQWCCSTREKRRTYAKKGTFQDSRHGCNYGLVSFTYLSWAGRGSAAPKVCLYGSPPGTKGCRRSKNKLAG